MIKKMISAAALIAAGTALASADTWTTVIDGAEVLSANSNLGTLGLEQDYNYASYNWCVSFTVDVSNANTGAQLFTTLTTGTCLGIRINTTSGLLNIVNNETNGHLSTPDSTADADGTLAFTPVSEGGYQYLDITLSWDALSSTMTLTSEQEGGTSFEATLNMSEGEEHSSLIEYATLSQSSTFWTHSGDGAGYTMEITNINVKVAEVPEPSMFGVLAGLGALGLVATRRRRNRKA
ncbi:MAG: PEP-CTERM sorting domain-containing protein [Opitutae bacterium]|nr:PEP-CTERM sorting domain-containing protein [Opitutae bacterium]